MIGETTAIKTPKVRSRFRLPDIPERDPDEVTQFDRLFKAGNSYHLAVQLGDPETTLVEADRWIVPDTSFNKTRARYPDLLVSFDADPEIYKANNGYIVSEQGKPPDFVIEVASPSTADIDLNEKRDYYAELGIPEYWRFDETETGEWHGARLAGDMLSDGEYVSIDIENLPDGSLRGYSAVLNLYLHWEEGELVFYEPATGRPIPTMEDERRRADQERVARVHEQARADRERAARQAAEARIRELEELLDGRE